MQALIATAFLMLVGIIILLTLGPVIAGIFVLAAFLVLLVVALPVLVILSPWIVIGLIAWWVF